MSKTLSQAVNKYDNILISGDFNIDISNENYEDTSYFFDLRDTSNLKNFVTKHTCCKSLEGIIIDLILRNNPRRFQKTSVYETRLMPQTYFYHTKIYFQKTSPKTNNV